MKTDLKTLQSADFAALSILVRERIGLLSAAIAGLEQNALNDKIAQDLMLPCFVLLAQFCASVQVRDDDGTAQIRPSALLDDLAELARDGQRFRALNLDLLKAEAWQWDGDQCASSEEIAVARAIGSLDGSDEALDRLRAAIDAMI